MASTAATPSPQIPPSNSPPTDSTEMTAEESVLENKENLQGPHDWRKRLKPVSRDSSFDGENVLEEVEEEEEAGGTGDSPGQVQENGLTGEGHGHSPEEKGDDKVKDKGRNMAPWKKDIVSKRIKALKAASGQGSSTVPQGPSVGQGVGSLPPTGHKRRHQMQNPTESAFTRQIVNKPSSPGLSRRKVPIVPPHVATQQTPRTSIPTWDKKPGVASMVAGGRRGAAHAVTPEANGAAAKRRVEKVLKARLYLLQQNGPNSFLIGGDSPDHKYRVIIGPQRCSCGRGAHCVHIMFVMLRVFQVNENDPSLWCRTLKNYEVEALFRTFHERRSSLIQNLSRRKKKALKEVVEEESKSSDDSSQTTPSSELTDETETKDEHEEEDTCPICLLEMVEGESLTECVNGCQNKLHHHCIAVWFEECRRQNELLICPLCRATWKVDQENAEVSAGSELPVPPNTRVSSPSQDHHHHAQTENEVILPHAEPIPPEQQDTAAPWIPILGEELVSCLFSKNWMVREIAVKQLGRVAVGALLLGVGEGRAGAVLSADRQATTKQMLETCCSVLAFVCGDPVYKVFVATLRTLRTVLAFTPCRDEAQQSRLKALMTPVIEGILLKCADSNKRTSRLSVSAMQELLKGQDGELSLGREIVMPGDLGLGGLTYLLTCVTQEYNPSAVGYQWLLGRLSFLHKLLEDQSLEFLLRAPQSDLGDKQCPLEEYENYERVMQVLRFTRGALENAHQNVARMARHVFYQIARLQSHNAAALKHVTDLLDTLGLNIQVQLKRKLLARMTADFHFSQRSSKWLDTEETTKCADAATSIDDGLPNTPHGSAHSSPRCGSPQASATATSPRISVTVNNFVSGNLNFVPMAPPNSPERRRGPEGRSRSGTETDSPASGAASSVVSSETMDCPDGILPCGDYNELYASTPHKDQVSRPAKVDVSVSTSPTLAIRGINFNLSTSLGESSTDDLEINGVTMTIDSNDGEELAMAISSEDDVCAATTTTEVSSVGLEDIEAVHNTTMDSAVQAVSAHTSMGGGCMDTGSSVSSTDATAASGSSTGMLSEDLSDPTVSPTASGSDFHVSFKTEVASNSPNNTPARRAPIVLQTTPMKKEPCPCKEEVEKEEAQALAAAMEQSEFVQNPLPYIPGLSQDAKNETIKIMVQAQAELPNGERTILDPHYSSSASASKEEMGEYREGIHWVRGPMLGTGAFSTCYQARDIKTGSLVAVKQISFCRNSLSEQEEVVDAVREEIRLMSRISHPNIVRILGATQQACHFFMFMEWMPGGSVAYLLDRYGAFSENVIIKYTQQVLRGIAHLHDSHILHRDLKGANLLIDSTGERVRIADFGASARLGSRNTAAGEFQGQLLGTIAFMAPEVLRGENYGRSCDVWSVGCSVIEMATTKPPWGARDLSNHLALIFKIASCENAPPIPEHLSPPVRDLLLRCLECQREDRPPAKELLKHPLFTLYKT